MITLIHYHHVNAVIFVLVIVIVMNVLVTKSIYM